MASLLYVDDFGNEFYANVDCGPVLYEIVDYLIKPVFLAAGFQPKSVNEYIGGTLDDREEAERFGEVIEGIEEGNSCEDGEEINHI